jgi:hypothetical protein
MLAPKEHFEINRPLGSFQAVVKNGAALKNVNRKAF